MRVLIVEDEPNLGRQLRATLEGAGYAIDLATDGEDGHYLGSTETYDAIILDLGLPEVDGLTVLDRWRKEGIKVPVLVLTARDSWSDKVAGLDAGADDYLAKPFYTEELLARLRALLRRAAGIATADIEIGKLRIDPRASRVTFDAEIVRKNEDDPRVARAREAPHIRAFLVWSRFPFWTLEPTRGGTLVSVGDMRFGGRGGCRASAATKNALTVGGSTV